MYKLELNHFTQLCCACFVNLLFFVLFCFNRSFFPLSLYYYSWSNIIISRLKDSSLIFHFLVLLDIST